MITCFIKTALLMAMAAALFSAGIDKLKQCLPQVAQSASFVASEGPR